MTNTKRILDRNGFTIIELLIVIMVIGVLAVLVMNTFRGVQNRANAVVMANNFQQIEKGFTIKAIDDGISEWWHEREFKDCATKDEQSPKIIDMIENCGFEKYLQSLSSLEDVRNFTYDSDGDLFIGCGGGGLVGGVNIAVHDDIPYAIFEEVDAIIDGETTLDKNRCGKLRWAAQQQRIFFLIEKSADNL